MHLVKGYVGTGIFALGQAFKCSGLLLGPLLLVLIALMNLNCQHILVKTAQKIAKAEEREDVKPSFAETVEYTVEASSIKCLRNNSRRFGFMTVIMLCVIELGFCCVYFVFIAEHLVEITSAYGFLKEKDKDSIHIMLTIILVPMWLSTFLGNLKLLLPLSVLANILLSCGVMIVFYFTTKDGLVPASERNLVSSYKDLPLYFGIALFSFEGITFILPLQSEMKHPEKFSSNFGVLNVGMTLVCLLFAAVGILSYWKFGEEVEASVILNLPFEDPLAKAAKFLICVAVLLTFTLHMYIPFEVTYPLFYRKYGPFKHNLLAMCLYRILLAHVVPFLALFISLLGASSGATLALIIPPILELIAFKDELSYIQISKDILIIAVGVVGAVTGTV
ncbi:proton-coupled amino acid transporter 1-like, partial [Asbolus verrucosus]